MSLKELTKNRIKELLPKDLLKEICEDVYEEKLKEKEKEIYLYQSLIEYYKKRKKSVKFFVNRNDRESREYIHDKFTDLSALLDILDPLDKKLCNIFLKYISVDEILETCNGNGDIDNLFKVKYMLGYDDIKEYHGYIRNFDEELHYLRCELGYSDYSENSENSEYSDYSDYSESSESSEEESK